MDVALMSKLLMRTSGSQCQGDPLGHGVEWELGRITHLPAWMGQLLPVVG
jgi:hypothetical protein